MCKVEIASKQEREKRCEYYWFVFLFPTRRNRSCIWQEGHTIRHYTTRSFLSLFSLQVILYGHPPNKYHGPPWLSEIVEFRPSDIYLPTHTNTHAPTRSIQGMHSIFSMVFDSIPIVCTSREMLYFLAKFSAVTPMGIPV